MMETPTCQRKGHFQKSANLISDATATLRDNANCAGLYKDVQEAATWLLTKTTRT